METLELRNTDLRLRLVPEIGASVVDFSARIEDDTWAALMRRAPEPLARSSDAASFLLVPYSNRVRDGKFSFEGKSYQLRGAEKHAIHGDVRDRAWRLLRRGTEQVLLGFDSRDFRDVNFPFPFAVEVFYALEGRSLVNRLRLTNRGRRRMPAGLGFHPYFNRGLASPEETVELQLSVAGVYPGETPLPTGPMRPLEPEQDFRSPRPLEAVLDHCFGGWDGTVRLHWPQSGIRLRMEAVGDSMRHVIVYSPEGQAFFAVEPVSHVNDGFNLFAAGQGDTGVVVLGADEALEGGFRLRLESE